MTLPENRRLAPSMVSAIVTETTHELIALHGNESHLPQHREKVWNGLTREVALLRRFIRRASLVLPAATLHELSALEEAIGWERHERMRARPGSALPFPTQPDAAQLQRYLRNSPGLPRAIARSVAFFGSACLESDSLRRCVETQVEAFAPFFLMRLGRLLMKPTRFGSRPSRQIFLAISTPVDVVQVGWGRWS